MQLIHLFTQLIHLFTRPKRRRVFYVLRGTSGTGKSELGATLTPYNVAADDFPGLYVDGRYQLELQAQSHRWCESQVEEWMRQGKSAIAVHNTNCERRYYQPYIDLAATYGYATQIIRTEAVILPDGTAPGNVHGVSDEILARQRAAWEDHSDAG